LKSACVGVLSIIELKSSLSREGKGKDDGKDADLSSTPRRRMEE